MTYRAILVASIALTFLVGILFRQRLESPLRPEFTPYWQCRRIVSLDPDVTRILGNLGLENNLVGVTRDCRDLPEAERVPTVGDRYDPSYESIVALRPDLVILSDEQKQFVLPNLDKLKLETLMVSTRTDQDKIESYRTIGRVCGRGPEGRRQASEYQRRLDDMRNRSE
jgi:iron complex transport system substrate-binding protein